jgi:hypothetical protein
MAGTPACEPGRFERNRLQVVVWRGRVTPGNRRIPKHLKLAILSRGRIRLPAERVRWLLDLHRGTGWVRRLSVDLLQEVPWVDVTIELFLNQRVGHLSEAQINAAFGQYLRIRQARHFAGCPYVLWEARRAVWQTTFERRLKIELKTLFERARVPMRPQMDSSDRQRFWLMVYASFPRGIEKYISPKKTDIAPPSPPPAPTEPMPPLQGRIVPSCYNLRAGPSEKGEILGAVVDEELPVTVIDKIRKGQRVWYHVIARRQVTALRRGITKSDCDRRLEEQQTRELPSGTQAWFGLEEPLIRVADWDFFRNQLIAFEKEHKALSLNERITRLRQMSHDQSLPFDRVIGTGPGKQYKDTIPYKDGEWQLLKDYEAVRMPDGRWVDLQHLFVGLDVLRRPQERRYFVGTIYIGHNYAAATWAGDLGSAAADATLKWDGWDKRHPKTPAATRVQHYYGLRAPEWDLLGNLDAWGIHALRSSELDTVDKLLAVYYQNVVLGGADQPLTAHRQEAVERFLRHYQFQFDYENHRYPETLLNQQRPRELLEGEVSAFGRSWMTYRLKGRRRERLYPHRGHVADIVRLFLQWLERIAIENGVAT